MAVRPDHQHLATHPALDRSAAAAVLLSHLLRARIAVAIEPLEGTGEWGCDLFLLRWWRLAESAPLALCRSVLELRNEVGGRIEVLRQLR